MDKKCTALTYTYRGLIDSIIIPVEIFYDMYDETTSCLSNALWDTGAMVSVITPDIVTKLDLDIMDTMKIIGINSISLVGTAVVSVHFPNEAVIKDLRVAVCDIYSGIDMILGMDIITQTDFAISNGGNQTQFSFAIPPFKHKIDFERWTD